MRNTKLILAMLAGCTVMSGAAFAQDSMKKDPTPAASTATPTQTSSDSMKSGDSMKSSDSKTEDAGAMKSTHKKHKKAAAGDTTAPAKSSSSGM
jgi:pentapeptide MXKDX repeat protein